MRRVREESVGDVLRRAFAEANMTGRLEECRAVDLWKEIVGEQLARLTGRPRVRNGIMTVSVAAAPLRHDLMMSRSRLLEALNAPFGHVVITDIRFIG